MKNSTITLEEQNGLKEIMKQQEERRQQARKQREEKRSWGNNPKILFFGFYFPTLKRNALTC
jgi:hypothetical protein